jgi:polysaccharide export outer membrane protein
MDRENHAASPWRRIFLLFAFLVAVGLSGCATQPQQYPAAESAGGPMTADQFRQQVADEARITRVNEELMSLAVGSQVDGSLYRIGPEDTVKIDIFGVPELSREYRVDGSGKIVMPLVGPVAISGLSLTEAEQLVAQAYGKSYLRSPQVSAQVTEFRSQQFTVIGAVASPRVYTASRQMTLIEALAVAGGVTEGAGEFVYLTDRVRDPETGEMKVRSLLVTVNDLMRHPRENNVVLGEAAFVNVPRGGIVFVEGDVNRPGAIPQTRATSVLTALAQAGGMKWEADRSSLRVLRRDLDTGTWTSLEVAYNEIRDNPDKDIALLNGDVVVVSSSGFRTAWAGTWRAITGAVMLGFRPL